LGQEIMQTIAAITILVAHYDPAIAWFTSKLGFRLVEDTPMADGKRWVMLSPDAKAQTRILLARATTAAQTAAIGNQFGGRVGFFLTVDDFDATYQRMLASGVKFRETPRLELYGKVVVFEDCSGNGWDLLGPSV
jgi:catechol 2,3-dioxygenase-like lactoylglutathione lyase family enzyme